MEIIYTLHAKEAIEERKVEEVWIEETIKYPDELKITGNKYDARKRINGKSLRVIYVKESYIKIVTQYWIK